VVELLGVVVHKPSSLFEIYELLALLPHHTDRNIVGAESITELSPQHLVVREASVGVVGPPRADVTMQLLHGKDGLLHLGAAQ
jgi:4-hydroxy-L-threonine phosphate dehydrogenase PdxA